MSEFKTGHFHQITELTLPVKFEGTPELFLQTLGFLDFEVHTNKYSINDHRGQESWFPNSLEHFDHLY